ncbi:hypothetical protein B0H10DRAFT_2237145 [Mycena sp. CBHHK59/15]|nr:hypothetical protein B0H10DRAFT_2237145 [Mycena sp. CBHHK59/15]
MPLKQRRAVTMWMKMFFSTSTSLVLSNSFPAPRVIPSASYPPFRAASASRFRPPPLSTHSAHAPHPAASAAPHVDPFTTTNQPFSVFLLFGCSVDADPHDMPVSRKEGAEGGASTFARMQAGMYKWLEHNARVIFKNAVSRAHHDWVSATTYDELVIKIDQWRDVAFKWMDDMDIHRAYKDF